MEKHFINYLLILTVLQDVVVCRKVIKIGGIFHDEGKVAEVAFRHAINRFNIFSADYMLEADVRIVNEGDHYKAGQIACELASGGVTVIFGPDLPSTNEIIQSVCETLEIPQFQPFWNPSRWDRTPVPSILDSGPMMVDVKPTEIFNLYPDPKLVSKALATLVREMGWRTYTIIYESDDGLLRLQEVLKSHRPTDPPPIVKKLLPGNDHRPLLKEIKSSSASQIILDCHVDHVMNILEQAAEVNLMDDYHSYIVTSLDAHTLSGLTTVSADGLWRPDNRHRGGYADPDDDNGGGGSRDPLPFAHDGRPNITMMRLIDPNTPYVRHVVRDWEQGEAHEGRLFHMKPTELRTETALLYDALNIFLAGYTELDAAQEIEAMPLSCEGRETFQDGLRIAAYLKVRPMNQNGSLPGPLSGPVAFDEYGRRINFTLQIIELADMKLRQTGKWHSARPDGITLTITQQERQQEIVQQLSQTMFRVTSRMGAPYLTWKESNKQNEYLSGNNRFEGYSIDLIKSIAEILNFTYRFELVPDNNYGSYDPKTKEWDGLIRQLLDRKADLAICDLTITYERRKAVDFTMPFMTLGISILFSKAVKEPPELFSFMHPLSLDIWLYMATAYLAISIMIFVVARLAPGDWENSHPCNQEPEELENIWSIKNCLWLTLGSLMAQGCDILPKGISTRMIAGMWWFFSLIMTASYTANLAAFLTMERMGPTIESAEDLTKQTKIKYGCVLGGSTTSFFRDSNFSTYHRMWTQMQSTEPSVFEKNNKDGVKRVRTSKRLYAFLMESSTIEYEMERDCELMQVGSWLDSKGYGIAMPVNSPYRTAISGAVLKLQEEGKLHKLKEKWWKKMYGGGQCSKREQASDTAELGIDNVGGIFVVLGGGILCAFLVALVEFLWNVRKLSVSQHKSIKQTLKSEAKFAMKFTVRQKLAPEKLERTTATANE